MFSTTTQTRDNTFRDIQPQLPECRATVLQVIRNNPGFCDYEIAQVLKWPINRVTGRRNELVTIGLVEDMGTKPSPLTGRTVVAWRVKNL